AFIDRMSAEHGFSARALRQLFAEARYQPQVVAAMTRPVVSPPKYYEFASRFLDPARIDAGAEFWRAHASPLERAQRKFGVPPEIVVAILGVETYYGRNTGNYRVLDALTTLAFDYPRRADFFRGELEQFLLLAREQGISPPRSLAEWARDGITGFSIPGDLASDPVGLLMLEAESGPTYWLVFPNWRVLTRYNHSRLYASVVWQLAQSLREAVAR